MQNKSQNSIKRIILSMIVLLTVFLFTFNSGTILNVQASGADPFNFTTLQFASTDIVSVAVYETGNKAFVGDATNDAIIVLNGTTNQVITTITGVPGGSGGGMIVNETYGKVYFYTNTNTGVLDANTYQVLSLALPKGYLVHDEIHDKLYIVDGNAVSYNIYELDIATDSSHLLYSGSGNFDGATINPITDELAVLIYYPARIDFININTVAVSSFDIAATGGNHGLVLAANTLENKYYAFLLTGGYSDNGGIFILDHDTNIYTFVGGYPETGATDLEPLVFNPASNTLFSGAQIGTAMGLVDGITDEFTIIDLRTNSNAGHGAGEVSYSTDHGYFTSQNQIAFVDNATKTVDFISLPIESRGGGVASDIAVNQSSGKVYVIADNEVGKVFVLQDPPVNGVGTMIQDGGFENGAPNPYWMEYSSLGFGNPLICTSSSCGVTGAHGGDSWAAFGGEADDTELSQIGVIPASADPTTLNFWLRIPSAGTFKNSDTLVVEVDGTAMYVVTGDQSPAFNTYKKVSLDISAYADGGIHKIKFISLVYLSSDPASVFYVDDVELETSPDATALTFASIAAQDGWIRESTETSGNGGTMNNAATQLYIGDNAARKQYRGILSFNTASLPDNAVITKVTLKLKKQGITGGGNPVTMFQGFMVDIKKGMFGTAPLALGDFKATASKTVGPTSPALTAGWYNLNLTPAKTFINKLATGGGLTQIRLRFKLDDNNNAIANFLKIYSGNAGAANRPQLVIEYYVP